jgi:hypothetical protein
MSLEPEGLFEIPLDQFFIRVFTKGILRPLPFVGW